MGNFDNGVRFYTKASVSFFFPENEVYCRWCPMLRMETKSDRAYCGRTGEILINTKMMGHECPLQFEEVQDAGEYAAL